MPKLHVFDDDRRKLVLAPVIVAELKKLDNSWELGFCKPVQTATKEAVEALTSAEDCVCIIDVEIKEQVFDDFNSAIALLADAISSSNVSTQSTLDSYRIRFGNHNDYEWANRALAYTDLNAVPALIISTKSHEQDREDLIFKAMGFGLPVIANWKPDLDSDAAEDVKSRMTCGIAKKINEEWTKHRGSVSGRLWPGVALEQMGWFHPRDLHPFMKHDIPLSPRVMYEQSLSEYLGSVMNPAKKPANHITSVMSAEMHNALKRLVGVCACIHGGRSDERLPDMNVIVLLAAAWDPNAVSWYGRFTWNAIHPLMAESSSKTDLRAAVLALGGEAGLFKKLLVKIPARDRPPPWEIGDSNIDTVVATSDSVSLKLKCDVTSLANRFKNGKTGIAINGGSSNALLSAWKSLETTAGRTVDIEFDKTDNKLIFRKCI